MKSLLLFLLLLLPLAAFGQVNITGTSGTGYFLQTADGDTLHLRGTTPFYSSYRIALQDAINYSGENLIRVHVRSNIDERVTADFGFYDDYIEFVTDTVYVELPPDTVFVEVPGDTLYVAGDTLYVNIPPLPYESGLLNSVNFSHSQQEPGVHNISYSWNSTGTFNDIHWRCVDQIPDQEGEYYWGRVDEESVTFVQDTTYHEYGWTTDCNKYLHTFIWAQDVGWGTRKDDFMNLALLDSLYRVEKGLIDPEQDQYYLYATNFDPDRWQQRWVANSTLTLQDGFIELTINETGSQLWQWLDVFPADTMEVYTTVLKAEGANNLHLRLLADPAVRTSQDIYLGTDNILYNWWSEGSWGSAESAEFNWEPGHLVHKMMRIEGDTMYAKAWRNGTPEPGWMLVAPVQNHPGNGYFGIGAHNPGTRYILELGVGLNGAPAPRN